MTARKRKRVAIPLTMWSQLGPIPVTCTTPVLLDDRDPRSPKLFGKYDPTTRVITVDSACSDLVQLQTVVHEAVHAWLLDAGLRLGKLEEPVVDTLATAIVANFHPLR